jgi:hypothetical protein
MKGHTYSKRNRPLKEYQSLVKIDTAGSNASQLFDISAPLISNRKNRNVKADFSKVSDQFNNKLLNVLPRGKAAGRIRDLA